MSNIVERLRDRDAETDAIDRMLDEAADEITRLQDQLKRMRKAHDRLATEINQAWVSVQLLLGQ